MSKLGSYYYPDARLNEALRVVTSVIEGFNGQITVEGLKQHLGMAERSGAFTAKVASIKAYGLLEGRGELRATEVAQRAVLGAPDEADVAKGEAFTHIELFNKLVEKTGAKLPEEQRWKVILGEVTGASRIEVQKKASAVMRVYSDGLPYVAALPTRARRGIRETAPSGRVIEPPAIDKFIELASDELQLRLPKTADNIDLLISALNILKKDLVQKEKMEEEETVN